MEDYPRYFPVVEVQQTFYDSYGGRHAPLLAAMPPGFELTMKAGS